MKGLGRRHLASLLGAPRRTVPRHAGEPRTAGTKRVLIADPDPESAESLATVLRRDGYDTILAGDGTLAMREFRQSSPDLVLLEPELPGTDGIQVCRAIRAESSVPVIMQSTRGEVVDVVLGLESGADDYLVKPVRPKELLARVRAVLRRTEAPLAGTIRFGDLVIDVSAREVSKGSRRIELSELEFDLLVALARKPREVFTREALLEQVWGYRHAADTRLVNVHVQRLRAKVEDDPEHPTLIRTLCGQGYVLGQQGAASGLESTVD